MKPLVYVAAAVAAATLNPLLLLGGVESTLTPANVSVGNKLEAPAKVTLSDAALDDGLEVTLRSGDPARLRISGDPEKPGSAVVVVKMRQGHRETPEFWLQGLDSSGTVTYTAEASGFTSGKGTVTLTPSGIVVVGPLRAPKFITTTGAPPRKITIASARLDASRKFAEEQAVAGGLSVPLAMVNSTPSAGGLEEAPGAIPGGQSSIAVHFRPRAEGETTISVKVPAGFTMPEEMGDVTASVRMPGLAISDQMFLGQNLQVGGVLNVGELPPAGGVLITLTSSDPEKLLLSDSSTVLGSKSVQIRMKENTTFAEYFLQALGKSGTASYTASAPGYKTRTAIITLAPSGVIVTPISQGPPDEAQVLRPKDSDGGTYRMSIDLAKGKPMQFVVWTAQLDPATHHSADITVQALRPGVTLTIPLRNSNPAVGTVGTEVVIPAGQDHIIADFTPLAAGSTEISVQTPKDFTPSANSTAVAVFVR